MQLSGPDTYLWWYVLLPRSHETGPMLRPPSQLASKSLVFTAYVPQRACFSEALVICAPLFVVTVPTWVAVLGLIALILIAAYMLAGIFGPSPNYDIIGREQLPANHSDDFLSLIESLVDAVINRTGRFDVLTNGPAFYPAELDAIRSAQHSVSLEAYIFPRG